MRRGSDKGQTTSLTVSSLARTQVGQQVAPPVPMATLESWRSSVDDIVAAIMEVATAQTNTPVVAELVRLRDAVTSKQPSPPPVVNVASAMPEIRVIPPAPTHVSVPPSQVHVNFGRKEALWISLPISLSVLLGAAICALRI